jgi:hypothetical protein
MLVQELDSVEWKVKVTIATLGYSFNMLRTGFY